ncbi:MAG: family 43 glycosylhydrolase [Acidobacteriaceae bacterium]
MVNDGGRVLVYYVGRKRDGPLCVAAATASRPQGPYTDHGPIVCEPDGSIDPAFMRDENGTPYLIWKEDGNSQHKLTPIWAQPLTTDLLHLAGEKKQLIVNEPATWEGGVVEAPYVMRHEGRYYMFYAGSSCCGTQCNYAEGVARAEHLLGPWEKDPANPVIRPNQWWRCPGHGTAVETPKGADYLLYHAYPVNGSIYLGRESVLDKITWTADGWPVLNGGEGPHGPPAAGTVKFIDRFMGKVLDAQWRWPVNHEPKFIVGGGSLTLTAGGEDRQDFIARSLSSANYIASVQVRHSSSAIGSLAVIGNQKHSTGLGRTGEGLELWRTNGSGRELLWQTKGIKTARVWLRVSSVAGKQLAYSYSLDGNTWIAAGQPIDVTNLPQWDQGLRVGLISEGSSGQTATFQKFSLQSK